MPPYATASAPHRHPPKRRGRESSPPRSGGLFYAERCQRHLPNESCRLIVPLMFSSVIILLYVSVILPLPHSSPQSRPMACAIGNSKFKIQNSKLRIQNFLLQLPIYTVLAVFHSDADGSEFVANLVGCSPVLVCLGILTYGENHINNLRKHIATTCGTLLLLVL